MADWHPPLDPDRLIKVAVGDRGGKCEFRLGRLMVPPGKKISLRRDYDPGYTGGFDDREGALEQVAANRERLGKLQEKLWAQDIYGLLVILQGIDTAGKDGAIRHVMSGMNPRGCRVTSFKAPSVEELDHDYLWRCIRALPPRGTIGIFNRSYYEEVLVVRVHPEFLVPQRLPPGAHGDIWDHRFQEINNFEKYLVRNGIVILKFFLNLSKQEQKRRFLERIDDPDKNWKFNVQDYKERGAWDKYQEAFQDMINNTSTEWAPWIVIPADNKWFARLTVSETICAAMERLELEFPRVSAEQRARLQEIRRELEAEA
jgi:PPK2 family polyphosphate:nucleotide phosphotransferase